MANHKGSEGHVEIGSDAIAELKSWSFNETADTLEDTSMGDTARTYQSSLTTFTGSCEAFWDETDTAQTALTIGASVTLTFYPEGDTTGDTTYSGTAIVTSIDRSASFDGMVETSFSFQGTGALTAGTA